MVEDVGAAMQSVKRRTSPVFEVADQAPAYTKSSEAYSSSPRRKDLVHASVLKRAIHFRRTVLKPSCLLKMTKYKVSFEISSQHLVGRR